MVFFSVTPRLRCLIFIVHFHCCQNLTLPNVPARCLLPANDFHDFLTRHFKKNVSSHVS